MSTSTPSTLYPRAVSESRRDRRAAVIVVGVGVVVSVVLSVIDLFPGPWWATFSISTMLTIAGAAASYAIETRRERSKFNAMVVVSICLAALLIGIGIDHVWPRPASPSVPEFVGTPALVPEDGNGVSLNVEIEYDGGDLVYIVSRSASTHAPPYLVAQADSPGGMPNDLVAFVPVRDAKPRRFELTAVAVESPAGKILNPVDFQNDLVRNGLRSRFIAERSGTFVWTPPKR